MLAMRILQISLVGGLDQRLHARRNFLDEMLEGGFAHGIVGLRGHGDVEASLLLGERRAEFVLVEEPLFELLR